MGNTKSQCPISLSTTPAVEELNTFWAWFKSVTVFRANFQQAHSNTNTDKAMECGGFTTVIRFPGDAGDVFKSGERSVEAASSSLESQHPIPFNHWNWHVAILFSFVEDLQFVDCALVDLLLRAIPYKVDGISKSEGKTINKCESYLKAP